MEVNNKIIGIIGALDEEINEYLTHLTNSVKKDLSDFIFYEGILNDKKVVITKSGVGKVFAAMTAQKLIDTYNPSIVIFTGIAGALNIDFQIGDVVIANDCMQYDLDVTALGFSIGTIPYTEYRIFETDKDLKELALSAQIQHRIHQGRILTGDQFITAKDAEKFRFLQEELKGDAVEMEGASVGEVCTINKIPLIIIRTISDKADHSAIVSFNNFLPQASQTNFKIVNHIIKNINYEAK